MQYDEFFTQFKAAYDDLSMGRVGVEATAAEIERLRTLVPQLETDEDRTDAETELADLADLADLANEISPASRDRKWRASAVLSAALDYDGPIAGHIALAELGIRDITSVGMETDNERERFAIIASNEALATLVADVQAMPESQGRTT